jgi:hypothetical protein
MAYDPTDIRHVVQIHTNSGAHSCEVCGEQLTSFAGGSIAPAINHYLSHEYVLLHVGGEWGDDQDGKSIQHTVAILGRP